MSEEIIDTNTEILEDTTYHTENTDTELLGIDDIMYDNNGHLKNDKELYDYIKNSWKITFKKIYVILYSSDIIEATNSNWIKSFYHPITGIKLYYPLKDFEINNNSIYIHDDIYKEMSKKNTYLVRLTLSPKYERAKHNNPLQMQIEEITSELKNMDKMTILKDKNGNILLQKSIVEETVRENSVEIEKLIEEKNINLKELNESLQVIETQINDNKIISSELEKEIETQINNKEALANEIENLIKMRDNMNEIIATEFKKRADKLLSLGLLDEDKYQNLLEGNAKYKLDDGSYILYHEELENNPDKLFTHIQHYLYNKGIKYSYELLRDFFALIKTNDFIVLAGDSGTGKTSLVKYFADAIGGVAKIIPVKPNWTGSEDLLGYYNPIEKKFLQTEFTSAIIEAIENPDVPYFICLDEMNLARVEYYFADFLSLLEERNKDIEISLYTETEFTNIIKEVAGFTDIITSLTEEKKYKNLSYLDMLQDEKLNNQIRQIFGLSEKESLMSYYIHLRSIINNAFNIQSKIIIPNNIRFIGAINIDETTNYLSPKILDRAHIIKFKSPFLNLDDEYNIDEEYEHINKKVKLTIEQIGYRKEYPIFNQEDEFVKIILNIVNEFLLKLGIEFSYRTIRQGMNYNEICKSFNMEQDEIISNYLMHKVLPKFSFDGNKQINTTNNTEENKTKFSLLEGLYNEIIKYTNNESNVVNELRILYKRAKNNQNIVNYWA